MPRCTRTRPTSTSTSWPSRTAAGRTSSPRTSTSTTRTARVRLHLMRAAPGAGPAPATSPRHPTRRSGRPGPRPIARRARRASARLRARFAEAGIDAYFGVRREHMRYLTGFTLGGGRGEGRRQLGAVPRRRVTRSWSWPIRATRSRPAARRRRRGSSRPTATCPTAGRSSSASVGARRVGVEAGFVSHATWERLAAAAPDVELVPIEGWVEADRAVKEPAELERVAAACAVADRALATLLPEIRAGRHRGGARAPPGMADADRRRRGARVRRRLPVRARGGPAARRPGRPAGRWTGRCCCSTSGPRSTGYRSDMTRTLFVGEPAARDLERLRARRRGPRRRRSTPLEAAVRGRTGRCRAAGPWTPSPAPSSTMPATASTSATAPGTASASRRTRRPSLGKPRGRHAAAQPDRLLGRARGLPRGRDGRPHRGPHRPRCRARAVERLTAFPTRGRRRRRLTRVDATAGCDDGDVAVCRTGGRADGSRATIVRRSADSLVGAGFDGDRPRGFGIRRM